LVVIGLDFEYSLSVLPDFESRLPDNRREWLRDGVHAALSREALSASAATLIGNLSADSSDMVEGNFDSVEFRQFTEDGSYPVFAMFDIVDVLMRKRGKMSNASMEQLQSIIELCRQRGAQLILLINPVHADELKILDRLGYWREFESWKRDLVHLAAKYRNEEQVGHIQLWDFTGFTPYTTEVVSTDTSSLHWFWDPHHYTKSLGQLIVARISGGWDPVFGMRIDPGTIEADLANIRMQRDEYRKCNPAVVRRVHDYYNAALSGALSPSLVF
jgi:hypothetical protein